MVAPKENSEWMHTALTRNSPSNARLELIPGAGHFFEHRFEGYLFEPVLNLVYNWLERTLGRKHRSGT
jgi:pimeloyl-ACP methyl ester carboxylesterase